MIRDPRKPKANAVAIVAGAVVTTRLVQSGSSIGDRLAAALSRVSVHVLLVLG